MAAEESGKNGLAWVDHSDVYLNNARLDECLVGEMDTIQQGKHRHFLSREEQLRDIRREIVRLQAVRCAPSSVAKFSTLRPSSKPLLNRRAKTAPTALASPKATETANQTQGQTPGKSPDRNQAAGSAHPRMQRGNSSVEKHMGGEQRSFPRGLGYRNSADKRSVTSSNSGDSTDDSDSSYSDSDGSDVSGSDSSQHTRPKFFLSKSPSPPPSPPKKGSQLQARLKVLGLHEVPPHWYLGVVPAQDSQAKRVSKTAEYREKVREMKRKKQASKRRAVSAPVPGAAPQPPSRVVCTQKSMTSMSRRQLQELTAPEAPPTREMLRVTSHHRLLTAQAVANQRLEERVTAFLLSISKPRPKGWASHAPSPILQPSSLDKCSLWLAGNQ